MIYKIEDFSISDIDQITGIFNYYIANSFAAYPDQIFTNDFVNQILNIDSNLPKYVVKFNSEIVGFGFAYKYHHASVFDRVTKFAYFILPEHTKKGLGKRLLNKLETDCIMLEIESILVHISSLNEASIHFHRKNGFEECGRFKKIGKKFGKDFDDVWMQKVIKNEL